MKLTKSKLKQIIREELENVLNEAPPRFKDPGGFMGMHIGGDTSPIDTSGVGFFEEEEYEDPPEIEETLADRAIAALQGDEADDELTYGWVIEPLKALEGEDENNEEVINKILGAELGMTLDDVLEGI